MGVDLMPPMNAPGPSLARPLAVSLLCASMPSQYSIPAYVVAYATQATFFVALLGITYSILSASWDEDVSEWGCCCEKIQPRSQVCVHRPGAWAPTPTRCPLRPPSHLQPVSRDCLTVVKFMSLAPREYDAL